MKKNLIIIGASALGRGVSAYARDAYPDINIVGFLDSRKNILDGYDKYPPIIASPEEYIPKPDDVFVCALGEPDLRKKYVDMISQRGGVFISIIHPKAFIGPSVTIGQGSIITPGAIIAYDIKIGNHVYVGIGSNICHDCVIGDFVNVSPGCTITGWCKISDGCFLGAGSTIVPHVQLGNKDENRSVYVAAGAVVTKSYSDGYLIGCPAKQK